MTAFINTQQQQQQQHNNTITANNKKNPQRPTNKQIKQNINVFVVRYKNTIAQHVGHNATAGPLPHNLKPLRFSLVAAWCQKPGARRLSLGYSWYLCPLGG